MRRPLLLALVLLPLSGLRACGPAWRADAQAAPATVLAAAAPHTPAAAAVQGL